MGAVSTALFGDYTRSAWLLLAMAVTGLAFAGIGYCLWCWTRALAICCAPCRRCGRRSGAGGSDAHPDLPQEEAPTLRGPHGAQPTTNDFYASIKNVDRKRGGRPHVLVAAGDHTTRLAQPEGGATPRANAHGVVLDFTEVISASSRRARTQLEASSTLKVHLCREHPCRAEVDVALHATAYAPIDREHPLDLRSENPPPRRWCWPAAGVVQCAWWTFRRTGQAGYHTGRGVTRLGGRLCCCARRGHRDANTPGAWKDSLSETESEPEDTRCQAHLVRCADGTCFAKRCWDRALTAATRLIEEDAYASGLGLTGSDPGTARLCHCHAKTYELERVRLKCAYQACYQLGTVQAQGLTLCGEHARAHCRVEAPVPEEEERTPGSGTKSTRVTAHPKLAAGACEDQDSLDPIGGAVSRPGWNPDSLRSPSPTGLLSAHALVRGTDSGGHPAYFRFRAGPGRTESPAGWSAVYVPTLDWDLLVPQEVYRLDPGEGDLTQSMQGSPVIIARGALPGAEGFDDRGRTLSAQALSLIRAAIRHGSVQHPFCRSVNGAPLKSPREPTSPAHDSQTQLKTPTQGESALTREALRRLITCEATRRMPEGLALVREFLEALGPDVSPLTAAENLPDEYGTDDLGPVRAKIARAVRAYCETGELAAD